jgi:hypothetical protein
MTVLGQNLYKKALGHSAKPYRGVKVFAIKTQFSLDLRPRAYYLNNKKMVLYVNKLSYVFYVTKSCILFPIISLPDAFPSSSRN